MHSIIYTIYYYYRYTIDVNTTYTYDRVHRTHYYTYVYIYLQYYGGRGREEGVYYVMQEYYELTQRQDVYLSWSHENLLEA